MDGRGAAAVRCRVAGRRRVERCPVGTACSVRSAFNVRRCRPAAYGLGPCRFHQCVRIHRFGGRPHRDSRNRALVRATGFPVLTACSERHSKGCVLVAVRSLVSLNVNDRFDRRFIGFLSGVARSSLRSLSATFSAVHRQLVRAPAIGIFLHARRQSYRRLFA